MYFDHCETLDELKKAYRAAAMKNHPDRGGDLETMKAINIEYADRFEILKADHNRRAEAHEEHYYHTTETPEEFVGIINHLIHIPGLVVELCGSWIWISGNTMAHRAALKASGCRWSPNKGMWYWRHAEDGCHFKHRSRTMQQIRQTYGSTVFSASEDRQTIPA